MSTDRSDKLWNDWRTSAEKFDYFLLGLLTAVTAYIAQTYKPEKLGLNPSTLELLALVAFVIAVVQGFLRAERSLQCLLLNARELHSLEGRGQISNMLQKSPGHIINLATGEIYSDEQARSEIRALNRLIKDIEEPMKNAKLAAIRSYKYRNVFAMFGMSFLVIARIWSAYC